MSMVESARADWSEGHRRFLTAALDPTSAERLHAMLDVLTAELRRRVGQTFTLTDLAAAYDDSERWARTAVEEHAPSPRWPVVLSLATDEAFHRYSRGAVDFAP
jgi:hypothetical protein